MMGILEDTMILNTGEFNGLLRKLQKKNNYVAESFLQVF